MDRDRLRWITNPPTLDRWEVGVRYASTPSGLIATYTATGHCDRKRGALWILSDTCPTGGDAFDLADRLHQLATVCADVRPVTRDSLELALRGGYWEQGELPF